MTTDDRVVLASESPRRRALLEAEGLNFAVVAPDADETLPEGVAPAEAAVEVAKRKALSVAAHLPGKIIIGADTIVVTPDGDVLGKPESPAHAKQMLSSLSDTTHRVITGVYIVDTLSGRSQSLAVTTEVVFGRMTPDEIEAYVASGEAMGKAGAYAIQETGDRFVREVRGSFSNVVGLPVDEVLGMLARLAGESEG